MFVGVIEDLKAAVEKLQACEQSLDIAELSRVRNQFESVWLRAVGDYDRSEEWRAEGFVNAASALRVQCAMNQGTAHRHLKLARRLRDLPVVAEAFAAGELSRAHVEPIADAYTAERAPALAEVEEAIVNAAKVAIPRELTAIMYHLTGAIDGDDGAQVANEDDVRREVYASRTTGGIAGKFFFSGDDGETFLSALKTGEGPYRAGDPRTPAQRRADALIDLLRVGGAHFDQGPGRERPNADVTTVIDVADIEARGGEDLAAEVRKHRSPLPKETLRRLTCDARIARVITDGRSEVIDVGRATRTIPAALWRALVIRDGGCTTPGCDRPPGWCEVHHKKHWADGGETTLANTELKCRRCHRHEHEGGHDPPDTS